MNERKRLIYALIGLVFIAGCGGDGDRVLVSKCYYDGTPWEPRRHDVVVFRFPQNPIEDGELTNYIKRLLGLAGETIAIMLGQLFVTTDLKYDDHKKITNKTNMWEFGAFNEYMHVNDESALELFRAGKFKIIRKSPATMMAMRRIVYNNDFQATDLQDKLPKRWSPSAGSDWKPGKQFKVFSHSGSGTAVDWLRYQHIVRPPIQDERILANPQLYIAEMDKLLKEDVYKKPQLITDFSGYNSYVVDPNGGRQNENAAHLHMQHPEQNWVGDLMLDIDVAVEKSQGEFRLELSKGIDRFQARWNLQTGECTLVRLQEGKKKEELLTEKPAATNLSKPGTYRIRFANFDRRLTVWVNRDLIFEDGVTYKQAWRYDKDSEEWVGTGPTANDLQPASIGSKGAALEVKRLQLWRDTYYTVDNAHAQRGVDFWRDPAQLRGEFATDPPLKTMYVQPGHYLVLGDNSPESHDSRGWGLVPKRLLLGRALMVYWPSDRIGTIIH